MRGCASIVGLFAELSFTLPLSPAALESSSQVQKLTQLPEGASGPDSEGEMTRSSHRKKHPFGVPLYFHSQCVATVSPTHQESLIAVKLILDARPWFAKILDMTQGK